MPASARYRTHDGTCNSKRHPRWGAAQMPFNRFLPPEYGDGVDSIRTSMDGAPLTSSRFVSLLVHGARDGEATVTLMIAQWGQLLDHDMTSTAQPRSINGSVPSCCGNTDFHPSCFPIKVPLDDPWLATLKVRCLEFLRSAPAQRRDCILSWREQTNQATSYIDASPIYSNSAKLSDNARIFRNGLLVFGRGNPSEDVCHRGAIASQCIRAGDGRSGEQPGLLALHLVWVGEHNRIAMELSEMNLHWSDEKIYQETRRIVGAMFQHITYREFLPIVLGHEVCKLFDLDLLSSGYYEGYAPKTNPTVANSFAAAAFRFGHSLVQNSYMRCDRHYNVIRNNVSLHEEFQRGDIGSPGSLHRLIRGLVNQRALKRDEFITPELTNHLFQTKGFPFGLDLAAINIQRGRDHGIPPYTSWRVPCGLTSIDSWEDFVNVVGPESAHRISHAYRSVHDIDLFVGGIAERPVVGGLVGPTFACIIAQQFSNSRKGDRFWYENGGFENSFTPAQLHSIRRVSLAQVLCRAVSGGTMQPHVFLPADVNGNARQKCGKGALVSIDLSPWIEQDPFTTTPTTPPVEPDHVFELLTTEKQISLISTTPLQAMKEHKAGFLNRVRPTDNSQSPTVNNDFISNASAGIQTPTKIITIHNKLDIRQKVTPVKRPPVTVKPIRGVNNKLDKNPLKLTLNIRRPQATRRTTVVVNNIPLQLRSASPDMDDLNTATKANASGIDANTSTNAQSTTESMTVHKMGAGIDSNDNEIRLLFNEEPKTERKAFRKVEYCNKTSKANAETTFITSFPDSTRTKDQSSSTKVGKTDFSTAAIFTDSTRNAAIFTNIKHTEMENAHTRKELLNSDLNGTTAMVTQLASVAIQGEALPVQSISSDGRTDGKDLQTNIADTSSTVPIFTTTSATKQNSNSYTNTSDDKANNTITLLDLHSMTTDLDNLRQLQHETRLKSRKTDLNRKLNTVKTSSHSNETKSKFSTKVTKVFNISKSTVVPPLTKLTTLSAYRQADLRKYKTQSNFYTRPQKVVVSGPNADQYEIEINIRQTNKQSSIAPPVTALTHSYTDYGTSYKPFGYDRHSPNYVGEFYSSTIPPHSYYSPTPTVSTNVLQTRRTKPPTVIYINEHEDRFASTHSPGLFQNFLNFATSGFSNGNRPQQLGPHSTIQKVHPVYGPSVSSIHANSPVYKPNSETSSCISHHVPHPAVPSAVSLSQVSGVVQASSSATSAGNFGTITGISNTNGADSTFSFNIRPKPNIANQAQFPLSQNFNGGGSYGLLPPRNPPYNHLINSGIANLPNSASTIGSQTYFDPSHQQSLNSPFSSEQKRPQSSTYGYYGRFQSLPVQKKSDTDIPYKRQTGPIVDYDEIAISRTLQPILDKNLTNTDSDESNKDDDDNDYEYDYEDDSFRISTKFDRDGYLRPEHMINALIKSKEKESKNLTCDGNCTATPLDDNYVLPILNTTMDSLSNKDLPKPIERTTDSPTTKAETNYPDVAGKHLNNNILAADYDDDETTRALLGSKANDFRTITDERQSMKKPSDGVIAFAPIKILTKLERPDNWVIFESPNDYPLLPALPPISEDSPSPTDEIPRPMQGLDSIWLKKISKRKEWQKEHILDIDTDSMETTTESATS